MNEYSICTNYLEIIAGTSNKIASSYLEAANAISNDNMKSMAYLKNFITSIENLASKSETKDKAISDSKGNIKDCSYYENIKIVMDFIKKNLSDMKPTKDIVSLHDLIVKYQPQYSEGYQKNVRLIMLEYESAVYMLITGIVEVMCTNVDFAQTGTKIEIKKKPGNTHGTINDILGKLASELGKPGHKDYLEAFLKAVDAKPIDTDVKPETKKDEGKEENKEVKESVIFESVVTDTLALVGAIFSNVGRFARFGLSGLRAIKNSMFGIVPLIRSVLYLRYKKKADKIAALDQQVIYLQNNIDQLKNRKDSMDPAKKAEIIKKQQAAVEAYKKRAEKLRAELMEEEKEAATAIKNEDSQIKNTGNDGDDEFVLEGVKISEVFSESEDEEDPEEGNEPEEPDKEDEEETE